MNAGVDGGNGVTMTIELVVAEVVVVVVVVPGTLQRCCFHFHCCIHSMTVFVTLMMTVVVQ